MRRGQRRTFTETAANMGRSEITVFGQDPYGRQQLDTVVDEGRRIQGVDGGHVYLGDKGAPERSFNGPLASQQVFAGASAMANAAATRASLRRDPMGRDISTGTVDEGPFADPTMRIFAQRMARRSPL